MTLRVELKDNERLVIGDSVVINTSGSRIELVVKGDAPVLRERDVMQPEAATTVARRVYLLVQAMYLARSLEPHQAEYLSLIADVFRAAPSTGPIIADINQQIVAGNMFKALKAARALVKHEATLLATVLRQPSGQAVDST
jgi:flagellar protein FlbT